MYDKIRRLLLPKGDCQSWIKNFRRNKLTYRCPQTSMKLNKIRIRALLLKKTTNILKFNVVSTFEMQAVALNEKKMFNLPMNFLTFVAHNHVHFI